MSAKNEVILKGKPAEEEFRKGFRLKNHIAAWRRTGVRTGAWDDWLNPELLEQICTEDEDLQKLAKDAKTLDKTKLKLLEDKIAEKFKRVYLPILLNKFAAVRHDIANYFAAKADEGLFEKSRKLFESMQKQAGLPEDSPVETDAVLSLKENPPL